MKTKRENCKQFDEVCRASKKKEVPSEKYSIISCSRYSPEASLLKLIICHNYFIEQIRSNIGNRKELTYERVTDFFDRNQKIMEEINLLNADMGQILGHKYSPPRGYQNPHITQKCNSVNNEINNE